MTGNGHGEKKRVLFVDDEDSIRLTLPAILQMHGFYVKAVGSVSEALNAISSEPFDVLLSDLNIGEPGDGFTVVSAMRRTQPTALTIIITGFPAFETALQAIRSQVDDYVVKPTNSEQLVDLIQKRLTNKTLPPRIQLRPLSVILMESLDLTMKEWLKQTKAHPELGRLTLSDEERLDHLPGVVKEAVRTLKARQGDISRSAWEAAKNHGETRARQKYTVSLLIEEVSILRKLLFMTAQENLLAVEISYLVPELMEINASLEHQLRATVESFLAHSSIAA